MKQMGEFLGAVEPESPVEKNNVFRLDLVGAERRDTAHYGLGEITRNKSYVRNGKVLPVQSVFEFLLYVLMRESEIPNILALINREAAKHREDPAFLQGVLPWLPQGLEAMISDGWVEASYDAKLPLVPLGREARHVKWNTDPVSGA
jgi:hypothetical protein